MSLYENEILLEWDENKRRQILTERGIDFADTAEVLSDPNVAAFVDDRRNYGETRYNAYGISKGRRLRVSFTPRNGKIRVITMFKVSESEWSKYYGKDD